MSVSIYLDLLDNLFFPPTPPTLLGYWQPRRGARQHRNVKVGGGGAAGAAAWHALRLEREQTKMPTNQLS